MKRFFGLLLVMAMVFSLSVPAYAADRVSVEEEMLCAINALNKNFRNDDGCSTELVSIVADENDYPADEHTITLPPAGFIKGNLVR